MPLYLSVSTKYSKVYDITTIIFENLVNIIEFNENCTIKYVNRLLLYILMVAEYVFPSKIVDPKLFSNQRTRMFWLNITTY